jgi:hypothetical protein
MAHALDGAGRERIRMQLVPHLVRAERGVPLTHMPDGLFLVCRKPVVRRPRPSLLIGERVAHRLQGAPMELIQITATNPILHRDLHHGLPQPSPKLPLPQCGVNSTLFS